jgi:hypothetical protein
LASRNTGDDEGLNLYADMAADGSFGNAERFAKKINTKFHDYSILLMMEKTVFIPNNYSDGRKR